MSSTNLLNEKAQQSSVGTMKIGNEVKKVINLVPVDASVLFHPKQLPYQTSPVL